MGKEPVPVPKVMGVAELNGRVARLLEQRVPDLWIRGEVSRPTRAASGHIYFTLKEADARIDAVLFAADAARVTFRLQEGQSVLARGRVTIYAPQGRYQLVCDQLKPSGEGALRAAFLELEKRLRAEGLFDEGRKRRLPLLPRAVGLVTSPIGAALHDLCAMIFQRFPTMRVILCPVRVQGEGSAEEVARGIARLSARSEVDVLVVGRGGGSLEDLWTFNDERVVRAIAASSKPVVSAVGHEIDVTLSDLVADFRALTPTKAGEACVPDLANLLNELGERRRRIDGAMARTLTTRRRALRDVAARAGLRRSPRVLNDRRQDLDRLFGRLGEALARLGPERRRVVQSLSLRLDARAPMAWARGRRAVVDALGTRLAAQHSGGRLRDLGRRLRELERRLAAAAAAATARANSRLAPLERALLALDPLAVLARGFSITRVVRDGRSEIVRDAQQLSLGDEISTLLARGGSVISTVRVKDLPITTAPSDEPGAP